MCEHMTLQQSTEWPRQTGAVTCCVWGFGHVGQITATHLAAKKHRVFVVDPRFVALADVMLEVEHVENSQLREALLEAFHEGKLRFLEPKDDSQESIDAHFICVNVPNFCNGRQDLRNVLRVCEEFPASPGKAGVPIIIVRSTLLPGTTEKLLIPLLNKRLGSPGALRVVVNPCFVRGTEFKEDIQAAERIVVGSLTEAAIDDLSVMYNCAPSAVIRTTPREAELIKYSDNAFHALKVAFANELSRISKVVGSSEKKILYALRADHRLNISEAYLEAGRAFGGICLPQDLKAFDRWLSEIDCSVPILNSILESNCIHHKKASHDQDEN